MGLLDNFPGMAGVLDKDGVSEVFMNSGTGGGLYDVLNDLDSANLATLAEYLFESQVQFNPFPGAGGHDHDPTTTPSMRLADDSVRTEQIDRANCGLIYTGLPKVTCNWIRIVSVTTAAHPGPPDYGVFGHTDVTIPTSFAYPNADAYGSNQVPVVIATPFDTYTDIAKVFVEPLSWVTPTVVRIWAVTKTATILDVNVMVIGVL